MSTTFTEKGFVICGRWTNGTQYLKDLGFVHDVTVDIESERKHWLSKTIRFRVTGTQENLKRMAKDVIERFCPGPEMS